MSFFATNEVKTDEKGLLLESDLIKFVKYITNKPGNNVCFDCGLKSPKWCSVTFGILLCLECAGKHRDIGVSYSFIRSLDLDPLKKEEAVRLDLGGNNLADKFFNLQKPIDYTSKNAKLYKEYINQLYECFVNSDEEKLLKLTDFSVLQNNYEEASDISEPIFYNEAANVLKDEDFDASDSEFDFDAEFERAQLKTSLDVTKNKKENSVEELSIPDVSRYQGIGRDSDMVEAMYDSMTEGNESFEIILDLVGSIKKFVGRS